MLYIALFVFLSIFGLLTIKILFPKETKVFLCKICIILKVTKTKLSSYALDVRHKYIL